MAMVSALEQILLETEAVNQHARRLLMPLTSSQLMWQPGPNRWSLAEIFAHLEVTITSMVPSLDVTLAQARDQKMFSGGPFRLTPMGRFFVWYVEPPPKIKLPAPKPLRPTVTVTADQILPSFLCAQEIVLKRIREADGLDLNRARFTSPFASFVKMDLLALFSVFTGHERRHLWQAENVVRDMPSARAAGENN